MSSVFDKVMAEPWEALAFDDAYGTAYGTICDPTKVRDEPGRCHAKFPGVAKHVKNADRRAECGMRAAVAVLGKRALALILAHEWCGREWDSPGSDSKLEAACPRCERLMSEGHGDGCEWGALCEAARRLKGGP